MQQEIERLIQNINDAPDKLHSDYTPSVHRLIEIGEPALKATLQLMLTEPEVTRLRAQRVIEGITMTIYGFRFGHGWRNEQDEESWRQLWRSLGDLSYDAPLEMREKSVNLWQQWFSQSQG